MKGTLPLVESRNSLPAGPQGKCSQSADFFSLLSLTWFWFIFPAACLLTEAAK